MAFSFFNVFSSDTYLILKCRGGIPDLGPMGPERPGRVRTKCFNGCLVQIRFGHIRAIRHDDCLVVAIHT